MKTIKDIKDLSGKKVIVRVDFNVPVKNGKILDIFRIKKSFKTIEYLHKKGAILILISHLGEDGSQSLLPVFNFLKKYFKNIQFVNQPILSHETDSIINNLKKGDIILFENIRRNKEEKENSITFTRAISRFGDIYINDAFSVSHRKHASIVGLPNFLPSYAGFLLEDEIKNLSKSFNPKHPFLFLLGGAKFETKMPLIKKFIKKADYVFIGGALANTFFKAKGFEVGQSICDNKDFNLSLLLKNKSLFLPIDVATNNNKSVSPDKIKKDEKILDLGPLSIEMIRDLISKSKFILWNGPFGKYEDGFGVGTEKVLKIIASCNAYSIIGGGDTVSIISKLKIEDKFSFISTGGGATLDFLSNGTLPGIKALK